MSLFGEEISQQPEVAATLLKEGWPAVREFAGLIRARELSGLYIAARGSSDHAATYGKFLFEVRNRMVTALASPSAFTQYSSPPRLERFGVIGISQSGAGPDVVAVMEEARRQGALTIAITNQPDSPLGGAADHLLPMAAGPERSVPASKTYTASLLVLAMLSEALDPDPAMASALNTMPDAIRAALAVEPEIRRLLPLLAGNRLVVLGRGYHLATAMELALKLTETSYLLTRANSVADFMHGPVSVAEPGLPALLIDADGPSRPDLQSLAAYLSERGVRVLRLTDGQDTWPGVEAKLTVRTGLPESLTPIPFAVAGQLLSLHLALARGLDPDRPRELSKVTRTW